jgi:iron complex transport system substrate-binding protein
MKRFLGLLLSAIMLTGVLAGCAGTPSESNETSKSDNTHALSDTSTTETSEIEEAVWPRTYTDSKGREVTIEKKPERIAVTFYSITENLAALDKPIVAGDLVPSLSSWETTKPYFEKHQVEDLGSTGKINLEKLLEMEPDIILAGQYDDEVLDQLEKIAPVIVLDNSRVIEDWKASLREVSVIIGEEDTAEKYIEETEQLIQNAKDQINALNIQSVSFVRLYKKSFWLLSQESTQMNAFYDKEHGLGLPLPQNMPEDNTGELTLEALAELNPEYIFLSSKNADSDYLDELSKNSVWNALTAVKGNHVYQIDDSGITGSALSVRYGVQIVLDALIP